MLDTVPKTFLQLTIFKASLKYSAFWKYSTVYVCVYEYIHEISFELLPLVKYMIGKILHMDNCLSLYLQYILW